MPILVQERPGIGRCAVAACSTKRGESLLVEKASLYWQQGPNELLDIIQAYKSADAESIARIDDLTSAVLNSSTQLQEMIQSWLAILQDARSTGNLPAGNIEAEYIPLLLKAHFNAHAVQSPDGACLFPQGAMLNHSCSPNTFYRCAAHTIHFVASTDLQQGTELTAAYLDAMTMLKPTKYRQAVLLLSKGFLCACERCASSEAETTRSVACSSSACTGLLQPRKLEQSVMCASQWTCTKCGLRLSEGECIKVEEKEDALYSEWEALDTKISRGEAIYIKEINAALAKVCAQLHASHFIAQLLRVLLIELGIEGGVSRMQLVAHSFIYATWLFKHFRDLPFNLLGTMTGALANLFDRKNHHIIAGLDIDCVLSIIKTVLPYARLRYGEDAAYPRALTAIIDQYSTCSSLICQTQGKLMRCGRCDSAAYCSRSCQVFHYKSQGHKNACTTVVDARKQLAGLGVP